MNLIDALKTIEAHMRPGMTIECWMLSNGGLSLNTGVKR